jgi:hypothetical protein
METRFCKKCQRDLPLSMYHKDKSRKSGFSFYCKECKTKSAIKYQNEHKEEKKAYKKKYWEENKHRFVEDRKKYREAHREDMKRWHAEDYAKNRDKIISEGYKHKKERLKNDALFKYKENVRHLVYCSFKRKGHQKTSNTQEIIGCTFEQLKEHLNKTFYENYGVEYDGQETVHIDHIVPLATAKTKEDVIKLCHFSNLQLLKAKDNIEKSDKIDFVLPK